MPASIWVLVRRQARHSVVDTCEIAIGPLADPITMMVRRRNVESTVIDCPS